MTRLPLLAALAGVIIVAAGLLLVGGGGPTPVPSPAPTSSPLASASAAASSSPAPLPAELGGSWVAAPRGTAVEATDVTTITLESSNEDTPIAFWIDRGVQSMLPALANEVAPGQIELRSTTTTGSCEIGGVGRYDWTLSADGQWLSFDLVEDACDDRATILPGSWQRSLAHANPGGPGIAAVFVPYFTFTLPADTYIARGLTEADTVITESDTSTYKVWRDLDGFVDPCDIDAGRIDLEGMDDVLAYFEEDPRFTVTERDELTLDGLPAVAIRFTVGADLEPPCWSFDGNEDDLTGVLTFVPHAMSGGFWNDMIGGEDWLVITEVDGVSLTLEVLTFDGDMALDRATLETIRFLDELPAPPAP